MRNGAKSETAANKSVWAFKFKLRRWKYKLLNRLLFVSKWDLRLYSGVEGM